jgi:alpha-L-rhamnosidase
LLRPADLRLQDYPEGGFVGMASPTLSWRLSTTRRGVRQLGYELEVAPDRTFGEAASSGFVETSSPIAAPWPFRPLQSREDCFVRVRIRTVAGQSEWSEPLQVEAALLEAGDWQARPISPRSNVGLVQPGPAALLRRSFLIDRPVARARLYVTSLGVHETWLNGERVGDALLDPGWTAYGERLLYAAYDVTRHLGPGENVLASAVGDGWWRGNLTWLDRRAVYGDTTALLAQLEIDFQDGSRMVVASDPDWRGSTGAILSADIYDGATCDLTKDPSGWRQKGFDDSAWEAVERLDLPIGLEMRPMAPIRVIDSWFLQLQPTAWGTLAADIGQNLAGYIRLRASGPAGASIVIRHAEVLTPDGRLYTAALRNAKAIDRHVLAGGACELEPAFTFHGFRYVEIECDPGVTIDSAEVIALSSDLEDIGEFACSDERLNRLFQNICWSQRSNFLSLPTDCPQRDERMGWTGDIQVFAPTACANANAGAFLSSWLKDLAIDQRADGAVPSTVPNVIADLDFAFGAVGWGDAAVLTPWALYEAYGDASVLERQFASMCAWVDWCASRRGDSGLWTGGFQFGDWLDPGAPPDRPDLATTDSDFIANAYLSFSARTLAKAANVLGRSEEAHTYDELGREVASAAWERWRNQALTTQTGCAIAIVFGIAPPEDLLGAAAKLAQLVEKADGRIATGFLGTPLVLPALTRGGQIDAAYRLLLNEQCPGWLYQVAFGATTMWERWDAIRPNGQIHAGEMSFGEGASMMSFNHYAYGAVGQWLYRSVAGIAPDTSEPGYGSIVFAPKPGGGLNAARARLRTPYGSAAIDWSFQSEGSLRAEIEIPPGARGRFEAPKGWKVWGVEPRRGLNRPGSVELGSGTYVLLLDRAWLVDP